MIHFYGEVLLATRPTPKLEDHRLSDIRDCLLNIFAATLHTAGRSSIHNLTKRPVMMIGTNYHGLESTARAKPVFRSKPRPTLYLLRLKTIEALSEKRICDCDGQD